MTRTTFLHSNTFRRAVARRRPGATLVECAIALPVMFFVLFALLDLGLAATRYNTLAEVARKIAREAVLHGSLAPLSNGTWGPNPYAGTVADGSPIVASAQNMVPTISADDVSVQVTWPDNDNSSRTNTGAGGTGLGLSICREIIARHGGNIWAKNVTQRCRGLLFTSSRDSSRASVPPDGTQSSRCRRQRHASNSHSCLATATNFEPQPCLQETVF